MLSLRTLIPVLLTASTIFSQPLYAQSQPVCQTDSDFDGDGWGWENFTSCRVVNTSSTTNTSACVDSDGDGYGWNGTNTCTPTAAPQCIDIDGDGYGWNGSQTCLITPSSTASNNTTGACIDTDGDGYGWDGTKTCRVAPANNSSCIDPDGDGYGWDGTKTCKVAPANNNPCIDPDGDGYGWDGTKTCQVAPSANNSTTTGNSACVDHDGDGYGWNGTRTCTLATTTNNNSNNNSNNPECIDLDGDGYGWDGTGSCQIVVYIPPTDTTGITDVVLMMGQSNALGEDTQVNLSEDSPDSRVIVWTQFDNWQIGNLCTQKWQKAWFPWRGGTCSNHPAFQIAKHIVELDSSRRVAVIPTGTAGKPIRWWDANGIADLQVNATVQTALNSLGRSKVDLIAWSQGEADHGNEDVWLAKLNDLISRLRARPWFDASQGQFIAQETKTSSVNNTVKQLSNDGDPLTDWVQASDQPTKDGVHWSASAIRKISERFAQKYVY